MLNLKNGKPLNLISQDSAQEKFIVNDMTIQHMKNYNGDYSFISICGDYRSGKSFLMNSLFFNGDGFQTASNIQSCTKGIKIWSQPLQNNGLYLWIIDTQGFGSTQKDSSYDGKIFLMNLLLGNVILYNSFGAIDQNNINKLAMICRQAKFIDQSIQNNKLYWILRDFSLQMVDKSGHEISEDQYLQQCLMEHDNNHNKSQKQFLKKVFKDRKCITLIRPVIDEQKLNNLNKIDKVLLRQQFQNKISYLHNQLLKTIECKKFKGIPIGGHNLQIFVKEFVKTINSNQIDTNLNSTYDKIMEYQLQLKKQQIIQFIRNKVKNVQKILPVQQQHITYLKQQNIKYIKEQINEFNGLAQQNVLQLATLTLTTQAHFYLMELEKENLQCLEGEIQQYLYRHLIEIYPKLIMLGLSNFQTRYSQYISKIKLDYTNKYQSYFLGQKTLASCYNRFMEQEEKKIFFELAKRWRLSHKQIEEKYEELKKTKKVLQDQIKKMKDQKVKWGKSMDDITKQKQKSLQIYKLQIEQAFKDQVKIIADGYEVKIRQINKRWEQQIRQSRNKIDYMQKEKNNAISQLQYEIKSLNQQISLQKQKNHLAGLKHEQFKNTSDSQQEQLKNTYETKLKILQIKYSELSTTHSNERKKYQMISDERKLQQSKILEDLHIKNERIEYLSEQIGNLQQKYKQQMQRILIQQKQLLCNILNNKINQYQYKCKIYQNRLVQYAQQSQQKQYYHLKCQNLQKQLRESQSQLQDFNNQINILSAQIKRQDSEFLIKQNKLKEEKEYFQKQLSFAKQNANSTKKYLKQYEERNIQQIEYIKNRLQNQHNVRMQALIANHEENIRQNKLLLEHKFDKERTQLKQIIKNNYQQIQNLKILTNTGFNRLDKMYSIIHQIKANFQNIGNQTLVDQAQNQPLQNENNSYRLVDISESPQEYSQKPNNQQKYIIEQQQFLAEQIEQIYNCLTNQIICLRKQRREVRDQLQSNIQTLESYEKLINKVKNQNKQLKNQVQDLRQKTIQFQSISQKLINLKEKYDYIQNQNQNFKKQIEVKDQRISKKEQKIKQNIQMYKQNINNLTQQNKNLSKQLNQLAEANNYLQSQLQRFKIWSTQVKSKQKDTLKQSNHNGKEKKQQKIATLQNQIKKLLKTLQEEKIEKLQKQTKKDIMILNNVRNQNRLNQMQALREENSSLRKRIEEINEKQLKSFEENRHKKHKKTQEDELRYSILKEDYENYKKKAAQTISKLNSQISMYLNQNNQLKQELQNIEISINKKYESKLKIIEGEIQSLKKQKIHLSQILNKKNYQMNEMMINHDLSSKQNRVQIEKQYEGYREELQKQHNRLMLQSQRYRMKYDHLLKVNGELIKEIQSLKSKAHQITLKQKYKEKIARLFQD